jgi:transglutaminase-like putative cysteine protease
VNGADLRTAVAAGLATVLGALALTPVYASGAWVPPVLAVVLVVLAGGLLLRVGGPALWQRFTGGRPVPGRVAALGVVLVPVGQLFLLLCLLTARFAPGEAILGVLPTPASVARLGVVLADGSAEIREQATPALPLTGLLALTALFVGLVAVTIDLVAVAGRQAAAAGLCLLVLYCVPVATITGGIGIVAIAAPAAGLAVLLWADQQRRLAASGRGRQARPGAGILGAAKVGVAALLTGLVVGSIVPTLSEGSLATGLGGGAGGSTGTALDPVAQLQGQLTLPDPIDLLRVESSVEDMGYLRAVTLDEYDPENGWSMSNLDGSLAISDDDRLSPLPADQEDRPVTVTVRTIRHKDRFLPVPFSPLTVDLLDDDSDDWRFDPVAGTVFGRDVNSEGVSYTATAQEPRPPAELLARAEQLPPGNDVQQRFAAFPPLDPRVTDLVTELTAGASTPYERVRRIHAYLTDRANGFRYSLSTKPGNSGDDLLDFLSLRRGYCEQYAAAMGIMVRVANVPSRLAIGYTPGRVQDDGSRLITSDDAHMWVEVYFDDLGWVPFDPTPIAADRRAEMVWAPRADAENSTDVGADVPVPSAPAPVDPRREEDRAGGGVPTEQLGGGGGSVLPQLLMGAGIVLLAAAVLGAPAAARTLQRRRRLASGTAGDLWDELAATVLDTGLRMDPAWTPRQAARELSTVMRRVGVPGDAANDAVVRLARAEETASYGRAAQPKAHPDLAGDVHATRRALLAAVPRRARLRALLWPASLVTAARAGVAAFVRRRTVGLPLLRRRHRPV